MKKQYKSSIIKNIKLQKKKNNNNNNNNKINKDNK